MKTYIKLCVSALAVGLLISLGACRGTQHVTETVSYYDIGTSLVDASPSGIITMRAWGSGPDKARAIEEAKKNAVSDVIFRGFKTGGPSPMLQAIVNEVNARERYAEYFDRFFANGGEYKKFVTETSGSDKSRIESESNGRKNYGVTLTVDRPALKAQLRADGIIRN